MSLSFGILICLGVTVVLMLALLVHLYLRNRSQSIDQAAHAAGSIINPESELEAELTAADEARERSSSRSPVSG